MSTTGTQHDDQPERRGGGHGDGGSGKKYLRFAAMILTGMVVMYWTMFAGTWEGATSGGARAACS